MDERGDGGGAAPITLYPTLIHTNTYFPTPIHTSTYDTPNDNTNSTNVHYQSVTIASQTPATPFDALAYVLITMLS